MIHPNIIETIRPTLGAHRRVVQFSQSPIRVGRGSPTAGEQALELLRRITGYCAMFPSARVLQASNEPPMGLH